jgi:hypothetical protein
MRRLSVLVAPLVGVALIVSETPFARAAPPQDDGPLVLFEAGLKALEQGDPSRADLLTQLAVRRQADRPRETAAVWKSFKGFLEGQKLPTRGRLSRLLAYRDSLDPVLLACRRLDDFDAVYAVRAEVLAAIGKTRSDLLASLQRDFAAFLVKHKDKSAGGALEEFASAREKWEPDLLALTGAAGPGRKPEEQNKELEALHRVAKDLASRAADALKRLEERLKVQVEQDGKNRPPGTPGEGKAGPCESLLRELQALSAAVEGAQLARWLDPTSDERSRPELEALVGDLALLQSRVVKHRHLRYNLWALGQIHAAETGQGWETQLGAIEVGLLHPAVSALYSLTYDARVRQISDAQTRVSKVRTLLTRRKVTLEAF